MTAPENSTKTTVKVGDVLRSSSAPSIAILRGSGDDWWLAVEPPPVDPGGGEMAHLLPDSEVTVVELTDDGVLLDVPADPGSPAFLSNLVPAFRIPNQLAHTIARTLHAE